MLVDVLGAQDRGIDPEWPPVLIVVVLVVVGAAVVSVAVVFRALRSETRSSRRWSKERDR